MSSGPSAFTVPHQSISQASASMACPALLQGPVVPALAQLYQEPHANVVPTHPPKGTTVEPTCSRDQSSRASRSA